MPSMDSLSHLVGRKIAGLAGVAVVIQLPSRPQEMAKRDHNRILKEALRGAIVDHHKRVLPQHFDRSAHGRYGYQQRSIKYIKEKNKRYGSSTDLVKSGKSRQRMLADPHVVLGGSAAGGKKALEGKLGLKFDFTGGGGRRYRKPASRQAVTIEQLQHEIRAMTASERRAFAQLFRATYLQQYRDARAIYETRTYGSPSYHP